MKFLILLFFSLSQNIAFAYKIAVYTDQPGSAKANEVIKTFKETYPFNRLDIEIEIKNVSADKLNCRSLNGIERLVGCDSENIAKDAAKTGIDQAFIVKNNSAYGGSGGSIPVITAGSTPRMILHEYLHTLGLCDEYSYSAKEAESYCRASGANMAIITPVPDKFANDKDARGKHMGVIPWNYLISNSTLISNSNQTKLGTGAVDSTIFATPNDTKSRTRLGAKIGLYEGKTCKNAKPALRTWQPGLESTIMENLNAGLGAANEEMVFKILLSRGAHLKDADASVKNANSVYDNSRINGRLAPTPPESVTESNTISK